MLLNLCKIIVKVLHISELFWMLCLTCLSAWEQLYIVDLSIEKLCKAVIICYNHRQSGSVKAFISCWFWCFSSTLKARQKHVLCWQSCSVWQESVEVCVCVCVCFAASRLCILSHFPVTKLLTSQTQVFMCQNNKWTGGRQQFYLNWAGLLQCCGDRPEPVNSSSSVIHLSTLSCNPGLISEVSM